jgi:predicted DNA-binding transcriptional regulator AlpA
MDGWWVDGWIDGKMVGWIGREIDEWMDGRTGG